MTIIVFLVDTSASMQQRAYVSGRSTLLDVAKGAVEFFVKMRQKSAESRGDRYMLLTFEEFPKNIKAGWKENLQTFTNELKNLEANGMTTMGSALKQVFDILNINRMQTGIDMYGQGRYPFYLEPAVIIVISDGGKLTTQGSVQSELNLPMHSSVPGSELTREPFRWDQRLYALVLRMAGTPPMSQETGHVASDNSPIDAMCEVTGGRSYAVTSQRVLHQCIDSLVQKLQSGVVIHFEKIGPDPPPIGQDKEEEDNSLTRADTIPIEDLEAMTTKGLNFNKDSGSNSSRPHTPNPILSPANTTWHSCRRLIYVPRSAQKGFAVGFWPLPEAFLPDVNAPSLPQRSAHPKVNFSCQNQEPMIIDNLPFDKYELEPSPLTLYILARKSPKICWQVYIQGSSKSSESGHPFGYLKASTNMLTVNLFVLPYNYPVLLPLLDDLFKIHRLKPTNEWRAQFHNYLRTMPSYFAAPLRRALTRMGAGNLATSLIPETMDNCLSYSVLNYLKRLKNQAKVEYDKTLNSTPVVKQRGCPEGLKIIPLSPFKKELLGNHLLMNKFNSLREHITDYPGYLLGIKDATMKTNKLRNPFDIPRHMLLDQLVRMRSNFLQPSNSNMKLLEDDAMHSLPIGQMGNYQDYLKKMPVPLREIESQPVRQHMFGNPFKINKNMILDEVVDEVPGVPGMPGGGMNPMGKGTKRPNPEMPMSPMSAKRGKKGPLPKDFVYRRTPPTTPQHESDSEMQPQQVNSFSMLNHLPNQVEPSPAGGQNVPSPNESIAENNRELVNGGPNIVTNNGAAEHDGTFESESDEEEEEELFGGDEDDMDKPLVINTSYAPPEQPPSPPMANLQRQESFRLSTSLDVSAMASEIASVIGSNSNPNGSAQQIISNGHMNGNAGVLSANSTPNHRPEAVLMNGMKAEDLEMEEISPDEKRSLLLRNQNMRQMIYKEIKRPGKNHDRLFEMLKTLQGPKKMRKEYIEEVIKEAERFKRKDLADLLQIFVK